jgi:hypothetical protein
MGFFDSGIPQGLNQASDTLLRTGMGMMKYNQDKLIQDQAMKIRQEEADRERIAFERQEAAIKEQEAKYNAVVPASKYFPKIREFPSYRQSLIEGFKALNLPYEETPDGDIMGKYGHGQEVMQWIYASGERAEKQARGVYADLQTQKMAIIEQLKSVKKPEEAKALNEQLEALSLQQGQVLGSTWDVQKKIAEEQGKPPKAPTQVIVGDEIKYRDENGNFVEGLGGPRYKPTIPKDESNKQEKAQVKKVKDAVAKLRAWQVKNYKQPNTDSRTPPSTREANEKESMKVEMLIAQLESGEVNPDEIRWPTELKDGRLVHKTQTSKPATANKPPAGFKDTGKTSGGKKVYTDGKGNAWLE